MQIKIALVQYDPVWENKKLNMEKIAALLEDNLTDSDILVFPELTLTGFTMNSRKFAEALDGASAEFFSALAKKYKCHVFAGIIERGFEDYFNTLLHFDEAGRQMAVYRKVHPFSFSGENRHYSGGKEAIRTFLFGMKAGLSVCYDLRFPELFRCYARERVEIIINIANWPVQRIEHWRLLLRARAVENQCFVVGVNRVGRDKANQYNGCSAVVNPWGEVLAEAGNEEMILSCTIETDEVANIRKRLPFLDDMVFMPVHSSE